jgi:hypothetical protein
VSDTPLVPGPLYGLRTWKVVSDGGRELLAGPHHDTPWPIGGGWLVSVCARGADHTAPAPGCGCGINAWHPRRASARRVLASRREVVGIVEAGGAVEVHEEGFRAERARPHALLLVPGCNPKLIGRLAATYRAEVVGVSGRDALLAWCRKAHVGLDESVVAELLGPAELENQRRARRWKTRKDALRVAAALLVTGLLGLLGQTVLSDPPGERVLHGRTGEIHVR